MQILPHYLEAPHSKVYCKRKAISFFFPWWYISCSTLWFNDMFLFSHQACLLTILYLEPSDIHYYAVEAVFRDVAIIPPAEPISPPSVDPEHYAILLEMVELLRPAKLHQKFGWNNVKSIVLSYLEEAGYIYNLDKNSFTISSAKNHSGKGKIASRRGKLAKISSYLRGTSSADLLPEVGQPLNCNSGGSSEFDGCRQSEPRLEFSLDHSMQHGINSQLRSGAREELSGIGDCWSNSSALKQVVVDGEPTMAAYQQQSAANSYRSDNGQLLSGYLGIMNKCHSNLTLDDIQQVLSATVCDATGAASETPMDERALKEITAFLQSEFGRHPDGTTSSNSMAHSIAGGLENNDIRRRIGIPTSVADNVGLPNNSEGGASSRQTDAYFVNTLQQKEQKLTTNGAAMVIPQGAFQNPNIGSTILVTESNLPYLQQFLPNLQTVMQSVQSLVRGAPPGTSSSVQQNESRVRSASETSIGSHGLNSQDAACKGRQEDVGNGVDVKNVSNDMMATIKEIVLPRRHSTKKSCRQ